MVRTSITLNEELYKIIADQYITSAPARKVRLIFGIIFGALAVILLVSGISTMMNHSSYMYMIDLPIAALILYVVIDGLKRYQHSRIMDMLRKSSQKVNHTDTREYVFDEKEIHVLSVRGESIYKWTTVASYFERAHYLMMRLQNNTLLIIDRNLTPAEDMAQIENWLKENTVLKEVA